MIRAYSTQSIFGTSSEWVRIEPIVFLFGQRNNCGYYQQELLLENENIMSFHNIDDQFDYTLIRVIMEIGYICMILLVQKLKNVPVVLSTMYQEHSNVRKLNKLTFLNEVVPFLRPSSQTFGVCLFNICSLLHEGL